MFDDEPKKKLAPHEVGMPIDTMSIDELNERIAVLEAEIVRLQGRDRRAAEDQVRGGVAVQVLAAVLPLPCHPAKAGPALIAPWPRVRSRG